MEQLGRLMVLLGSKAMQNFSFGGNVHRAPCRYCLLGGHEGPHSARGPSFGDPPKQYQLLGGKGGEQVPSSTIESANSWQTL